MRIYQPFIKQLFAISLLLYSLSSGAHTEKLIVGFFDLPPHAYAPENKMPSPAMLFFDQVANHMSVEVEYVHYPLAHLLFMLETNRIDAALMLAKNEDRSKQFVYSAAPIFTTTPVIAVLKHSNIKTLEEIITADSFTIGVWQGGFHSPTMKQNKNKTIALAGNDIAHRGLKILAKKRIDAFFSPDIYSIEYAAKKYNLAEKITVFPIPNEGIDLYTVFSKITALQYQKRYEEALAKVKAQNSYESILKQHTATIFHD